jgi:hypothetical protein
MLVPAWLSDSAPHQLRMTGAMAPIYLLVALGLDQVARAASRRIKGALVVAALVASGALTARDYFVEFAAPAVSRAPFDADVVEIAARLPQGPTLIGPIEPEHPALRFVAAEHETYRTFPLAALPLVVGPVDYFVRLPRGAAALANIRAAYPNAMVEWSDEVALARVAAGAAPIEPPPSRRLDAQFGAIWLLGVDARSARAGEELPLRLYWRAASPVDRRWTVFVHLVDETGRAWAHEDLEPGGGELPTRGWSPGEIVLDDRRVPLAPGIPPGDYRVRVGLVDEHGERGRLAGGAEYVEVGPVPIERGQGRANLWRLPMTRVEVDLSGDAGAVRLVGYRLERDRLEAGEALPLLLVWEPIGAATGLQAEVLVGPVRAPVASARGPVGGRRPVERWATNELLQEARAVALPPTLPAGRYEVAARLIGGNGKVVPLGAVSVESRARTFAAAQPQATVGVQFGGFAELTGYELAASPVAAGQRIQLRLYWRALATPVENYTVFLHLIDAGDRVRGQVDGTPAGGRAPTRTWLPGEMIVEERSFTVAADAAPGSYRLAAGLYLPSSGERAPITAGGTGDRAVFGQVEVAR